MWFTRGCGMAGMVYSVLISLPAVADVVDLTDGRSIEGKITAQNKDTVQIDSLADGTRVSLNLKRSEIKSVTIRPVPEGFFDPAPADDRVSDAASFSPGDTLYLEIPIVGTFGQDVGASAVATVLRYAKRHNIPHIVFSVDSVGGNLDEAGAIYRLLRMYGEQLTYHAIIRRCVGDALAVPLWCDTIHLLPGGAVGGSGQKFSEISKKIDAAQEEVIRSQIAYDVAAQAEKRGRNGAIVRAMLDPLEVLAGWRDEAGKVAVGRQAPADVPASRRIFENDEKSVLVLSYEQAIGLGMKPFDGTPQDLGAVLGLSNWREESDYGQKVMARWSANKQKETQTANARYEARVKQNVERRETTERYIQHNIEAAAKWNPTKQSYSTYGARWNWRGDLEESTLWTTESRQRWRDLTDASMLSLQQAARGALAMKKLDEEAVQLGLAPTYKPGELDLMIKDMQTKYSLLAEHRNRQRE